MSTTTLLLYGGEVKMTFDPFRHVYTVQSEDGTNKIRVPSVTTVLGVIAKPQLINWAANQAVEYLTEGIKPGISYDELQLNSLFEGAKKAHMQKKRDAADIGSMVHDWIEKFIKGENPSMPINDQLKTSVENFLKWKEDHKVKFILSEQPVYSKKYNYCGTLDFVATMDGKLFLGDIKTSKAIYDEYWVQLASYGVARSEEFPKEKYETQGIIRISSNGEFEFRKSEHPEEHFKAFIAAKGIYDWQMFNKDLYFKSQAQ